MASSHVLQLQTHDDPQGQEFVEQEFERIRRLDGIDLRRVLADRTSEVPLPVLDREVTAVRVAAHILDRPVRFVQEAVLDHHGGAMADQAIPFHLAEPQAALAGPSFRRLPREDLHRAARPDVELAGDHVVELLVVDHADENLRGDHAARAAVVPDLLAVRPEAVLHEGVSHRLLPLAGEGRAVDEPTFEAADLPADLLEDVGHGHPGRNRMGIDDQVRDDALRGEGHVFLRSDEPDDALLPVARRELVAQLRDPEVAHLHLRELRAVLALRQHDRVDPTAFPVPHRDGRLAALLRSQEVRLLFEEPRRTRLPDQDFAALDEDLRRDEAIIRREVRVRQVRAGALDVRGRDLEVVFLTAGVAALLRAVRSHERRAPEAAIDRGLVHDERVFHVVPVVGHHRDDEILARGTLVEGHVLHRVRLHERLLRVVEQVAPGIRPQTVVARSEAQGLLGHPGAHRDARGRVVLRIRHDAGGDPEDHHRVDLDVGVLFRDRRFHREGLVAMRAQELGLVVAAPHVRPRDVVPAQRVLAFLAPARDVVRIDRDERVFLLFRVDPLNDPVPDEVGEPKAAHLQFVDVLSGEDDVAILHDEQRSPDPALVAVDDDLPHVLVQADIDLVAQEARSATLPDLGHEHLRVLVESDEVSVDVHTGELGLLALDLLRPEVGQEQFDLFLRESLRHIDHEGAVLDQPAVLALRRLVRTEAAPLGRMEVARLEVRLGPRERGGDAPKMAQRAHVRRAVEKLADAGAPADPVAGRQRVEQPLRQEIRPDRRGDLQLPAPRVRSLQLVFEILHEIREGDPEQVLHQVARELQPLVRVVVLVVLATHAEGKLEDRAGDASEEDRLLDPVLAGVAEVREERPIEDRLDLLDPVFLRLARRELLLEVIDRVVPREDPVRRVDLLVLTFLDVRVDDVRHLGRRNDRVVDVLVLLHAQGFHEDDQRDLPGRGRHADDQLPVLLLLHQGEGAVPFFLGEDLRDLDLPAVPFIELDEDAIRGKILERDQGPLRPADDEVPARVVRVLAHLDELAFVLVGRELPFRLHVLLVEEAPFRLDHDREVADVHAFRLPFDAVLDDREVEVDRGRVVQVPKARFHRVEGVRCPVRLLDDRQAQRDRWLRLEVNPSALVAFPADPDFDDVAFGPVFVELDDATAFVLGRRPEVVYDPLHPRIRIVDRRKEVVERGDVMVDDGAFSEERVDEFAHGLPPDDEAISLRHARGPAHPCDTDDPAFLDGPLDLLEDLDHGIALPNLRELVSRDLHRLQNPLRLFLRHEAMLWY